MELLLICPHSPLHTQNFHRCLMCQMTVLLDLDGRQEKIMENVTQLETTSEGVQVSALFEEPKLIPKAQVIKIDFMDGKVILANK